MVTSLGMTALALTQCSAGEAEPGPGVAGIPEDSCGPIATQCHSVATGETLNCHNIGHANDKAACDANYQYCMSLCAQAVAAAGGSGGSATTGGSAGLPGGGTAGTAVTGGSGAGTGGSVGGSDGGSSGASTGGTAGNGGMPNTGGMSGMTGGSGGSGGSVGGSGGAAGTSGMPGGGSGGMDAGGGTGPGGGSGGGGNNPACMEYCSCMAANCAEDVVDDCLSACEDFTEEELTCWSCFCEDAANNSHNCEHATGELGLNECEIACE